MSIKGDNGQIFQFMSIRSPKAISLPQTKTVRILSNGSSQSELYSSIQQIHNNYKDKQNRILEIIRECEKSLDNYISSGAVIPPQLIEDRRRAIKTYQTNEIAERKELEEVALSHIKSGNFLNNVANLHTKIYEFTLWIYSRERIRLNWRRVKDRIEAFFDDSAEQVIQNEDYQYDRKRTGESIIAISLTQNMKYQDQEVLIKLIKGFGIIEYAATLDKMDENNDKDNDNALSSENDKVSQYLDAIAIFPSDVFPQHPKLIYEMRYPIDIDLGSSRSAIGITELSKYQYAYDELIKARDRDFSMYVKPPQVTKDPLDVIDNNQIPSENVAMKSTTAKGTCSGGLDDTNHLIPVVLDCNASSNLSPVTKEVLQSFNYPIDQVPVVEAVNYLEKRISFLAQELSFSSGSTIPLPYRSPSSNSSILGNTSLENRDVRKSVIGVADLMIVKQQLLGYKTGEIGHIENVLKGEFKRRSHRRLHKTEEFFQTETETTKESENELATTERFELQNESQNILREESELESGVTVTARYGPSVQVSANMGYGSSTSAEESKRISKLYSRDVTERALARVQERIREERSMKITEEIEEINVHGIDNRTPANGHISGIYEWVDKVYKSKLINYGKRLMFDFVIPEPAKFFKHSLNTQTKAINDFVKPEPPMIKGNPLLASDITIYNYMIFSAKYGAEVTAPPPKYKTAAWKSTSRDIDQPDLQNSPAFFSAEGEIKSNAEEGTAGYRPFYAICGACYVHGLTEPGFSIQVAGKKFGTPSDTWGGLLHGIEGTIPISLLCWHVWLYSAQVNIIMERTSERYTKWQIETYQNIMQAYYLLKTKYDERVAAASIQQGISVRGRNPGRNREIEKEELKKLAISMLRSSHYDEFGAVTSTSTQGYPEMDFSAAESQGSIIQFFEQAFEWSQMTYLFYPYFWGKKDDWVNTLNIDEPDSIFAKFLTAGAARVLIPIRPNYEEAIMYYLETGMIWLGGDKPHIDDPLYVSIVDEIRSQENPSGGQEIDSWDVKVPTSLVYLRKDDELPPAPEPTEDEDQESVKQTVGN